ncbi:protein-S-isoprenylcysteine methyltransferase [Altererythrobacter aquiaggeris]|uniref:methyltransferase family protein n=1 Tax=Aestuarierythrobacter aquiaggeris TaxID=1898396 RepID=UPI0030173156
MENRAQVASRPPISDVSGYVGLTGLLGFLVWLLFCRNYPAIAAFLELPGRHQLLSGPYAALLALAFSGGPMVLWSIFHDKVHRRASTGIDWDNPRSLASIAKVSATKIAGLWATWAIIGAAYCLGRWYWSGQYLFAMEVIGFAALPLIVLSVPYVIWIDRVMINPRDHTWHFGAMLMGREPFDWDQVKCHWRSWIIKGFFGAFMVSILPGGWYSVVTADAASIVGDPVSFGVLLFELLFLIDVQIGTVGYLLTLRPLDAHIRSGNPFLSGWVAALICYPPFVFAVMAGQGIIAYEVNTADWAHWFAGNTLLLWIWAALLVALTVIYAWATAIFGIRFSNLTYRGVLTNGPYRFTRHPAYLSKNLFWWCSTMPFMVTSGNIVDVIRNTFFLGVVSAIYYWRARTEEAHLLGEDPKYREYYDWMAQHGLITRNMRRIGRLVIPRRFVTRAAEPAE